MKHIDKFPVPAARADWQLIGKFELPTNLNAENIIRTWLTEILRPLDLDADILNKLFKSAQDAIRHVLTSAQGMQESRRIHLFVFAQGKPVVGPHNWGFFRIEKADNTMINARQPIHRIEIYLYLEG